MEMNNLKITFGNINNYIIKDDIGEGNFGKMKLVVYKPTGEEYAMKILNKETIKQKMKNIEFKENEIIMKFNHINIINVFELIEDKENFYIIMEFCKKGELFDYIVDKKRLSEDEASIFFYQLINGVSHIHNKGISHRDLKPENILLTSEKILKIIDFGLSHEYDGNILLKTKCGSPSYAAPEIIKGNKYDGFKIDIWCCGIILYAMVCGFLPFDGENNKELFKKVVECKPEYPDFLSRSCKKLIRSILVADPKKRININDIKKTDFYLKGKELCKKAYSVNLDDLDKKSYNIQNEDNKNISENDNINNENKINININENNYIRKDSPHKNDEDEKIFTKIEPLKKIQIRDINNNYIIDKENKNINNEINEINEIIKKGKNNVQKEKEKEKNKYELIFNNLKDEKISKYTNINAQIKERNNMNSIINTFHKKVNKLPNIKKFIINDENNNNNQNNNSENESKSPNNNELNNIFKINKKNDSKSLNSDFKSKYNNRLNLNKNVKIYKLLETNPNEYDKIIKKYNNKLSLKKNSHTPNFRLLNTNENLKHKKLILDNNFKNNISNSIKDKLNCFTAMNTINNFDLENSNNKGVITKKNEIVPPIKVEDNSISIKENVYNNNINININNLNINNTDDNFQSLHLNKLNDKNLYQNPDNILTKINDNEKLGKYIKYRNNINSKNDKINFINYLKTEETTSKDNIIYNSNINSQRDNNNYKSKRNLSKLILNLPNNKRKVGNSIDLSNIDDTKRILKQKILKNFYYNIDSNSNNEHKRCNTINNSLNTNSEKTPQNVKKNLYINTIDYEKKMKSNMDQLNNRYILNNKKNIYKKGHKYQIALKEFLNLLKSKDNKNNINTNNNNSNKDFLPYL